MVGEHNYLDTNYMHDAVRHEVECIQNHPGYFNQPYDNDFSILTLKVPIDLTSAASKARAACLPTPAEVDAFDTNTMLKVSGWGTLSYGGSQPAYLKEADVPFFDHAECNQIYENHTDYDNIITDNMICAGLDAGGIDSCQGDSGGKAP